MALTDRITRRPSPGRHDLEGRRLRVTFLDGCLRTTLEARTSSRASRGFSGIRGIPLDETMAPVLLAART